MRTILIFAILCACACGRCAAPPAQESPEVSVDVQAEAAPAVDVPDAVSPADAASDTTAS